MLTRKQIIKTHVETMGRENDRKPSAFTNEFWVAETKHVFITAVSGFLFVLGLCAFIIFNIIL